MKTTLALSWRALISRLHPPLPMSTRDTQKLLGLIQTSFQRHLDREIGVGERHTKDHLHSMLINPLLGAKRPERADLLTNLRPSGVESLSGLQEWTKQPLRVFKEQIARGTASLETAKLCLGFLLRKCIQSDAASPVTVMADARISPVFLNWLWSSGLQEDGLFLRDTQFMGLLTSFLVAEQQYGVILKWLAELRARKSDPALQMADRERTESTLLLQMIKAECDYGAGLEGAMTHFVQYFQYSATSKQKHQADVVRPSGHYISEMLSEPRRLEGVSATTVDAFMNCTEGWTTRGSLVQAWQYAYHPTRPSPELGFTFLQRTTKEKLKRYSRHEKSLVIRMSLRIAELYVQSNQITRASCIMEFISANFPQEVGAESVIANKTLAGKSVANQDENLRLLEALAVT